MFVGESDGFSWMFSTIGCLLPYMACSPSYLALFPAANFQDPNLRLNKYVGFQGRYNSERVRQKIAQYKAIAARYDLSIHQLALAFVHNK